MLSFTNQSIGASTSFTYEPNFNHIDSVQDPNGNTTTTSYDANGNVVQIINALGNSTTQAYNAQGLVTSVTDALGNSTTFNYDALGNAIEITDPLLNVTSSTYDSAGNVTSTTDGDGRTTQFNHDSMNRLVQVNDAMGGITTYDYDEKGNLAQFTDARGKITAFSYDAQNRLSSRTDPLGNSETNSYDNNGNLISTTYRNGEIITFQYDAVNQLVTRTLPGNEITTFTYDQVGNQTSAVDPDSSLTMTYDGANRLSSVSTTGSPNQPGVTINYSYDLNGNRLTMVDGVTGTTTYAYDVLNRLTSITNPNAETVSFDFDAVSRRINNTFPNGVTTDFTYDAKGELTNLINKIGATDISTFSYTYDGSGNRIDMNTTRTGVSVNGSLNYSYDDLVQLIQATDPLPAEPDETFTYDPVGNRLLSDGQIMSAVFDDANRLIGDEDFTYQYDNNGNLTQKTDKVTSEITQYAYDAENKLVQVSNPGMTVTYRYDGLDRRIEKNIDGIVTRYVYDEEDILLEFDGSNNLNAKYTHGAGIDEPLIMNRGGQSFSYHTDALGSITDLTDSAGNVSQSYVYDSFGQIAFQTGSITNPYTYTGREFDSESGLYYYRARYYESSIGRFLQEDGLNLASIQLPNNILPESFGEFSLPLLLSIPSLPQNLYAYVLNNPINFIDPLGLFVTQPPCSCGQSPRFDFDKVVRCLSSFTTEGGPPGGAIFTLGLQICVPALLSVNPFVVAFGATFGCFPIINAAVLCLDQGFVCPN